MKATLSGGQLNTIPDCYIDVPGQRIPMRILPEISDSKSAHYNDEPVIGRSFPIKTFSYGDNRTVSMKVHFVTLTQGEAQDNLRALRSIQAAVYPDDAEATPYIPPEVCQIKCGSLLSEQPLCAVLMRYSVSFPTDVVWDEKLMVPLKFDVDLEWHIVYDSQSLPGATMILSDIP